MPKKTRTPEEKSQYDQEYMHSRITRKLLPFNKGKPEDMALLKHAESSGNFTAYIKELIRRDMENE